MSNEELFAKTYSRFKGSNFFSIIEDGYSYFTEQAYKVLKELTKPEVKKEDNENYYYNYSEYVTMMDSLAICRDFLLDTFGKDCLQAFDKYIKKGNIELFDASSEEERKNHPESLEHGAHYCAIYRDKYDDEGNYIYANIIQNIEVPMFHNICDVYDIIHEFMHATNDIYKGNRSSDRDILGESSSITVEFILHEYLVSKNICPHDVHTPVIERLSLLIKESKRLLDKLSLYYKVTSDEKYKNIKYNFSNDNDKKEVLDEYYKICNILKYYLGTVIAALNYKRYIEGTLDVEKIENYNFAIDNNDELKSLSVIFDRLPTNDEVAESIDFLVHSIIKQYKSQNK